jgi:hypothetical protein
MLYQSDTTWILHLRTLPKDGDKKNKKSSTLFIPTSGDTRQVMLLYQFRRWVTSASIVFNFERSNRRMEEAAQWGAPYFVLIPRCH